ncbi:hypothetical protein ACH47X_01970 [Promicromonospora kroppenstedtii]|uniref:Uncharacterized protein n=1 Tax=Promicromonospora kroppenstedtii TaxID=440482 RepID=A0ABW7XDT4_9MICO
MAGVAQRVLDAGHRVCLYTDQVNLAVDPVMQPGEAVASAPERTHPSVPATKES